MSRNSVLAVVVALGLVAPATAFAQVPLAGSAGAGNSAISGVPFGPANPSVLSDPSGIGNASRMPALIPNAPAPPTSYGSANPATPPRVVPPPYPGTSQRVFSAQSTKAKRPPSQRRSRATASTFTGICRGC
ncbi:MAG: hypothetical protein PS018_28750 [bacterium]|nr:hypothetical protein [bacterium]